MDSVHCMAGQSNANMSWIFLEIPPGISWNLLKMCSVKFLDTLLSDLLSDLPHDTTSDSVEKLNEKITSTL